ncbi:uncharacterized protein BDZ99DRAFT_380202 [Mytilinidion resinicola]|uniref:Swiss Army Knife RNA repair protein HAD domain-containing protein n=1 Tax=Mytilinidion resinicola TaxID=574789 RepID=A0A6A6YY80_9PEZI|nr:uncharacterized protein BDZ99DRAFT_380202 [Mytilinidion resinicola]KAF2813882.1 hypothetical protein BDZ99DRAFT_380202 [Mytilinidion resinicola]
MSNGKSVTHTVTALKRWSCDDKDLPNVSQIKAVHVYDFDNTLFASPLPNKSLWNGPTIGQLGSPDIFVNGGWWHDASILAATGQGADKEEARAWEGWWNEQIVNLVELTMQQKDALSVLLTGRSESGFSELIKRMVRSKRLNFDMVCLKPAVGPANQRFSSTMHFKQELLSDIVYTYKDADEIRIYEDRPKHTKGFRDFFFGFNKALRSGDGPIPRKPITAEVIQVPENATSLDPVTEVAEVQKMINSHNLIIRAGNGPHGAHPLMIKRTVFYTGYMIPPAMTDKLTTLVNLPPNMPEGEVRFLANSILITPKPCPHSILDKVGGIGNKVFWRVSGISVFENRLWAARVEPVPSTQRYYSENPTPTVVLALRRGAKPADAVRIQNWQPVSDDKAFEFESVVGEKVLLRVEAEMRDESEWESYFPSKGKRLHPREEEEGQGREREWQPRERNDRREQGDRRQGGVSANYRGGNQSRGRGPQRGGPGYGGRGGGGGGRGGGYGRGGGGGGGGARSRGRNGPSQYKSLDDVTDKNFGHASYDDSPYNAY